MQVCTSLQTDNHASTPPVSFYRPDALPAAKPTASKHWRQSTPSTNYSINPAGVLRQHIWASSNNNNNNNSTDWLSRQLKQPNWDNQWQKKRSNTTSRTLPTCPAVLRRWTAFSPTSWALAWCVSAGSSSDMQQHRCCRHRLRPQCCWRRAENTPVEVCRIHRNCVRHTHAFYLNITKLCQVCKMACINAAPANLKRVLCLIFCLSKFNSITII